MKLRFSATAISRLQAIIIAVVIVVAAVAAGTYYYLTTKPSAPEYIKIGWPVPLTGGEALFGEPDPWVAQQIEDYVNNVMGGIYLSEYDKKLPIKIIIRDTKSDPDFAATVAEDLITREGIHLMITTCASTAIPASTTAERYEIPCIVSNAPALAWLTGAPYEWSYLAFWTEVDVAELYVATWDLVRNKTNGIVAGLWTDDPAGRSFRELTVALAKERGYTVIDSGLVPKGTKDFSAYIIEWKKVGAEIFTGNIIPPDFGALWRQCHELGFTPKVATVGRAILFPSAVESIGGDLPLGLTTEVWWSPHHPYKSSITGQTAEELCEAWEEETGRPWTQPMGIAHMVLEIAVDAIKRAGSLDKEKIRDTIANTDLDTIVGHIDYKSPIPDELYKNYPKIIEYQDHISLTPLVMGQWVREPSEQTWKLEIIYNWKYDEILETAEMILIPSL